MIVLLGDKADRNSIAVRTALDSDLPLITADRVQLQQVLMNLILNGIEAMKDANGELTITSKRTADTQLLVSVSDSGCGLPAGEGDRIFDAFFTPKSRGPAWDCRSVGGLSSLMEAVCGRLPIRNAARHFSSHCPPTRHRPHHQPRNIGVVSMFLFVRGKILEWSWTEPHKLSQTPTVTPTGGCR